MSKAEDRALEAYPYAEICKEKYLEGYHQAEKDLELTWEHLKTLDDISDDVYAEYDVEMLDEKEYYQEVLNRFKDLKNGTTRK